MTPMKVTCPDARNTLVLVLLTLALSLTATTGCTVKQRSSRPGPQDADAPEEFTTTESGLKYRILRKGTGEKPSLEDKVVVDYSGWLDSGVEFDSSYLRRDSAEFRVREVVDGWQEGLQYVREGGMIELEVPSELGYGELGSPGSIPPNATLHFQVELHEIVK
ncbi:MAG: FKBP-type peptidyl-prolyl cis-trans isomerase [Planctomycetota bacterium]